MIQSVSVWLLIAVACGLSLAVLIFTALFIGARCALAQSKEDCIHYKNLCDDLVKRRFIERKLSYIFMNNSIDDVVAIYSDVTDYDGDTDEHDSKFTCKSINVVLENERLDIEMIIKSIPIDSKYIKESN